VRTVPIDLESIDISLEDGAPLPPGVEVRVVQDPKILDVKIDRVIGLSIEVECNLEYTEDGSRKLITSSPTEEGCVDGYRITTYYPIPRTAFVHGPASVLNRIKKVRTMPARVDDLDRCLDRTVRIEPYVIDDEYGPVKVDCNDEIVISVEVDELLKSRKLKDVPVRLLKPVIYLPIVEIKAIDGKPVDTNKPTVDLEILGPGVQISQIVPQAQVKAYLNLAGSENPGEFDKPLTVELPDGIRLGGKAPVVTYEIRPTSVPE